MFKLVFSIHQNLEEVGFNAGEGMDLQGRMKARRQRPRASFSHVPEHFTSRSEIKRLPAEGVGQIKGGPSHLQIESGSSYFK